VVYQTTSSIASSETRRWLIDSRGRLLFGSLMLTPPGPGVSAWTAGISPDQYRNEGSQTWLTVPGAAAGTARHYPIRLEFDTTTGDLVMGYQGGASYSYLPYADQDWAWHNDPLATSPNRPVLYSAFLQTWYGSFFPGQTWASGGYNPGISCLDAQSDLVAGHATLLCSLGYNSGQTALFLLDLPLANLETTAPSQVNMTLLESGGTSTGNNYNNNSFDGFDSQVVPKSGGGWLCSLPKVSGNGSDGDRKPLVSNLADGTVARRLEIRLPKYTASDGSTYSASSSSISQQAFMLPNAATWLAIDGFTQKLYVCSPWWQ
jgi:hypothetical protein